MRGSGSIGEAVGAAIWVRERWEMEVGDLLVKCPACCRASVSRA
jgi:hypothetical protein